MQAELLKHEGWKIDPATRFLVYKEGTPDEQVYTKVTHDRELRLIYITLGLNMWGKVGMDDLVDKDFVARVN